MRNTDLSKAQARALKNKLAPMLGYLTRLKRRMVRRRFRVRWIAADGGGNGHVLNRLLLDRLNNDKVAMYAILYSEASQDPREDGCLWKWSLNRSASIGALFSRVKKRSIIFPRVEECKTYLDEFACELATYDDLHRTVRYTHPENVQDDALHAANYALSLGIRLYYTRRSQDGCY